MTVDRVCAVRRLSLRRLSLRRLVRAVMATRFNMYRTPTGSGEECGVEMYAYGRWQIKIVFWRGL